MFGFILRAPSVDAEVLCAAISTYLMLGLFWTLAYSLVGQISPAAFSFSSGPEASHTMNGFNAFYFSFATLSTVGYGDIAPVSKVARMLAVMEAIFGMFYVTMLIARLVAMYSPKGRESSLSTLE
ncbi:MAG: potassium channel family protein [Verrucomicrobiaceae bacterium]